MPSTQPPFPAAQRSASLRLLLDQPDLGMRLIMGTDAQIAGEVTWAHPSELLDPSAYLRPGELLCTVGSALLSREASHRLCLAVAHTESAGICFGLGDVSEHVPAALVEAAESFSLPLVTIPSGVPFTRLNDLLQAARDGSGRESLPAAGASASALVTGRVLDLIGSGLASPQALAREVSVAGLDPDQLVVGVWPALAVDRVAALLQGQRALLARTEQNTLTVTGAVSTPELSANIGEMPRGFSAPGPLVNLPGALSAAQLAYARASRADPGVGPEQRTSLVGLLHQQSDETLAPFLEQLIRPLAEVDAQRDSQLVNTLRIFLRCEGSLQETARATFLHVNSVRHRLSRIHEVTGRDPLSYADRVSLHIGLWAFDRVRQYRGAAVQAQR
ncbi:PucR family transcriptional regulator [Leucobacter sp. M11]|uniref:PucR family transcriptional regulator n=1 Tax=Leucobacter sp. M11 TaxID=2993565 RepID=UPI002D7F2125|nr:PucR family transcriptional regulator [Leucobacter sp. M11]